MVKLQFVKCCQVLLVLGMIVLGGCAGSGGEDSAAGSVGTIVNNPKPVSTQQVIFTDFSERVPETLTNEAMDGDEGSAESSPPGRPAKKSTNAVIGIWNLVFLHGGILAIAAHLDEINAFNDAASEAMSLAEMAPSDTIQSVTFASEELLFGTTAAWRMEFVAVDAEYVRYYFYNGERIQASYLGTTDGEKGLLVFVNPDLLDEEWYGLQFVGLAFDFSQDKRNLFTMRVTKGHPSKNGSYALQMYQQGNLITNEYLAEYGHTNRGELAAHFRFSWNEKSHLVCLGAYDWDNPDEIVRTFQFTGPHTEPDTEVVVDVCTCGEPVWSANPLVFGDLPDDSGDTALGYYIDGVSKAGWDRITPDSIDAWLTGSSFEPVED